MVAIPAGQGVVFVPDKRAIQALLHGKGGMVYTDINKRALRVQTAAKRQVGVRTGRLKRSIHVNMRSRPNTEALVGSNVRYALLHHNGSRPHPIEAKPGRMLTFRVGGRRVFVRRVLHPGTKPNPYLQSSLFLAIR